MKSLLLLDLTGRVFLQKEKIFYWLVSAFFISLFLPDMPVVNNILIGATVVHSCYYNSFSDKIRLLRQRKEIWFMLLLYVWQIVSAAVSSDRHEGLTMLVLRAPLLVFPLFIGLLYIREELKDRILLSYCFFTTIAAMVCMAYAVSKYSRTGNTDVLYSDSLTVAVGRQSVYISMAVNLALFTYVYLLQKKSFAIQYKGLVFLSIAFLVVFHYMLASRIAILTLYTGFLVFAIWHYTRSGKILQGVLLVGILVVSASLMIRFFPNSADRFRQLSYSVHRPGLPQADVGNVVGAGGLAPDGHIWNENNFRISVWKCGWDLFLQHPWTGVPLGDKQERLMEVYRARHFDVALTARLNLHNTYLDILCNLGIAGLLVFLLGYVILPITGRGLRDGLGLFILLAFGVAMITETWPDRSIGCIMLGFFLSLVSAWKKGPGQEI